MTTRLASILAKSLVALGTLCFLPSPSPAFGDDVIFSNLGPGNSFDTSTAWAIAGPTSVFAMLLGDHPESVGKSFTPSANFDLTQVLLPLESTAGTNGVDVFLENSHSGLPGTILESWSVTGLSSTPKLEDLSASSLQPLSGGMTYWIVVAPLAPDTSAGWMFNDTGDSSEFAFNEGSGWNVFNGGGGGSPALEVTGTAVPEPSTLLLIGAGLLAFAPLTRLCLSQAHLTRAIWLR